MIAACVNCRDDEAVIGRWIKCVAAYAAEIIICDTGSKDRTKEIILDHRLNKLKLCEKRWCGFLSARNTFFDLVSQPYILQLDVDEVLLNSFWRKVSEYIARLVTQCHSIRLCHYSAQFEFTDFETLHQKTCNFQRNFCKFSYPRDVLYRSDLKKCGIEWNSIHRRSEIFNNLSTTRFFLDSEPLIHCYPANHKLSNDEYHARKMLTYAKLSPGYWEAGWTEFLEARFTSEKIKEMKAEILSSNDPAPHSSWWAKIGRFQQGGV
jgi:glycosyltransferase involved in cell wall biosynthesis